MKGRTDVIFPPGNSGGVCERRNEMCVNGNDGEYEGRELKDDNYADGKMG